MMANTTAAGTEHTDTMGLIDHHTCIILFRKLYDRLHIGHIALHRENAVGDDEFHLVGLTLLELLLKRRHIVVLVFQRLAEREAASLYDGSMILLVPENIVLAAGQRRHHTEIDSETGRIYHYILLAYELGYLVLKFLVQIKSAVEERRTGASCAILACCLYRSFLDTGIIYQTGIAIGAEHQHLAPVDSDFRILLARNSSEIRIYPCSLSLLGLSVLGKLRL